MERNFYNDPLAAYLSHKPATALPWAEHRGSDGRTGHLIVGGEKLTGAIRQPAIAKIAGNGKAKDAEYIVHAANAYPKLVEFLMLINGHTSDKEMSELAGQIMREIGESGE